MLFNSFEFLFFFIAVVIAYFLLRHQHRWKLLLISSFYFYMAWEATLVILLLASTLIDYLCGLKMGGIESKKKRKPYLFISIISNVGILVFFKYLGFLGASMFKFAGFFGADFDANQITGGYDIINIILPIGISFYTFQTMSYSIEVYRGRFKPERNFGRFALYVSYFPQLVAGPIERPQRLLPQFSNVITFDVKRVREGLIMMVWGFFLKLVVADRLGVYVDKVFQDPWSYSGIVPVFSAYLFTFQIYYDFAAYTTIAIGASKILGIDLMENFDRPFYSKNLSNFWRKWHISLMTWFRDYLYRPLVIDLKAKRYVALLIVFAVTGLWHGASWTFVIWGVLNGIYLIVERSTRKPRDAFFARIFKGRMRLIDKFAGWFFYFNLVVFSLIFFRANSFTHAYVFLKNIFVTDNWRFLNILNDPLEMSLIFILLPFVQWVNYFSGDHKVYTLIEDKPAWAKVTCYLTFLFVLVFFSLDRKSAFIYFQF